MRSLFGTVFFLFLYTSMSAQFAENIRSGRPGQFIGPYTLGAKVLQVQSGLNYNSIDFDLNEERSFYLFNNVIRLGLVEKWEVSGVLNWRQDRFVINGEEERTSGVSNTQLGVRYNILEGTSTRPAIGIQGRVLLRAQSEPYRRQQLGSTFILIVAQNINDWLSIIGNGGLSWRDNNSSPRSFYAVGANYTLSEKWSAFSEIYGNIEGFNANFDAGLAYLINEDFQLDVFGGWQGQEGVQDWFLEGGISWRIVWREEN
ncbi:MAG: transporter [Bacteroidota bacterium]